mgnify:CR=1 FL=1
MIRNVGSVDRIIRLVLAGVLGYLYFAGVVSGTLGIVLLVLGAIALITGLVGTCGLYRLIGVSTCKMQPR